MFYGKNELLINQITRLEVKVGEELINDNDGIHYIFESITIH